MGRSTDGVTIRAIRPADAPDWLRMRLDLWPEGSRTEHESEIRDFLAGLACAPQAVLIALDTEGQRTGFTELSIRPCAEGCRTARVAYLEGWYVRPGARGQGIGRTLVAAAEDWARSQGCTEFASDAHRDNRASQAAHLALGFEDAGLERCFRKDL